MNRLFRVRWRLIVLACLVSVAVAALVLVLWLWQRPGVEERLRAIDAAHVIPDEENAGRDYANLILDEMTSSLTHKPLSERVRALTQSVPWRSADHPEAAQWLADHRAIVAALLEAGRKPRCWFSVAQMRWHVATQPTTPHEWAILLLQAGYNDLGEGRTEAGLEKLLCLLRMADHFLAQDHPWYYRLGMDMAADGLGQYSRLVVEGNVSQDWRTRLEAALPSTKDTWAQKSRRLDELADLHERALRPDVLERLSHTRLLTRPSDAMKVPYLVHLSQCRAARVLAALRRHKDRTGTWPARLTEVGPYLSPEVLIDPFSGGQFRYGIEDDEFFLYSVVPEGTDGEGDFVDGRFFRRP